MLLHAIRTWHRNHILFDRYYNEISCSKTNRVSFIVPPEWIIEPKDVNVVRDDQAEVNCSASGHPKPTIKWRKGSSNKYTNHSYSTHLYTEIIIIFK